MAYTGNTLALIANSIEGTYNIFAYLTADTIGQVLATNYFFDGGERGMGVGDVVFAVCSDNLFILYVSAVSGLACTVTSALLAINGASLPTVNPGPGSGELWNNGGFVCVA